MTNFDFLFGDKKFASFSGASAAAEKIFGIDAAACAVNARRAAELAVKWMYENDRSLPEPQRDQLAALTGASEFRALVGHEIIRALDYIRRVGNNAAHNPDSITKEQAQLALQHLYEFTVFTAKKYSNIRPFTEYDLSLLDPDAELVTEAYDQQAIRELLAENRALKRIVASLRKENTDDERPAIRPVLSEADTRRLYVETALAHAGWRQGIDCFSEYPVEGMPGISGVGYADYVLCGENGTPLAIVETQSAADDISIGRQQAKLYADALEKKFGSRPILFLTNGRETRVWFDEECAERTVSGFYSRSDLHRVRKLRSCLRELREEDWSCLPLERSYQRDAAKALWDGLWIRQKRAVLLSMAPGTGKTRTALSASELFHLCGRVQNVLFLSENDILTAQAHREQMRLFPHRRAGILRDPQSAADAEILFSTFADLLAEADELTDAKGNPILTPGRFDLIICDEADLSVCRRYADVFSAFDASLVVLSSVPQETIPPTLYDILGMDSDSAVFEYPYQQAVADGYLSAAEIHDLRTELLTRGIFRNNLSKEERKRYDSLFSANLQDIPDSIRPTELLSDYFNDNTLRLALDYLHTHGRQRNGHLAKTIIFTENHAQSEWIYRMWGQLFPADPPHFCRVADSFVNYVQSLIEDFAQPDRMPQVVLSHDLLTDGIDLPAVENLVFFTRVPSRNVFWRMLGRGMRRCSSLPGGKPSFFVLDLCGDYSSFGEENPLAVQEQLPVWSRNFALQAQLAEQLQTIALSESCAPLRKTLVRRMHQRLSSLNRDSFALRRHLPLLDRFVDPAAFDTLSARDTAVLAEEIAPLLPPDGTPENTAQFNETMFSLMLARACRKDWEEQRLSVMRTVRMLSRMGTNKKIAAQKKLLNRILFNQYLTSAPLPELETTRLALEPLIRYLDNEISPVQVSFADRILFVKITGDSPHHDAKP